MSVAGAGARTGASGLKRRYTNKALWILLLALSVCSQKDGMDEAM